MHRLFVAIRPPPGIRAQLLALMHGVSGARWQNDGQLHLTLRFIGEIDRHRAEDVVGALNAMDFPVFEIVLNGTGYFECNGRRTTLWAGIAPSRPLKQLRDKLENAFRRIGLEPDHRVFLPHITIARLNAGTGPIDDFIADNAALSSPAFAVENFDLFESLLGSEGAHYESVARYPLR
ncbi:MAG: RNA 2',3'-cyclic phosphodiesterase [Pseudomonadota bacterium]